MMHGSRPWQTGTRFKLFPQPPFLEAFQEPETVWVSPPAGSVGPGPADDRMYVIDPIGKQTSYGLKRKPGGSPYLYLPPWDGPVFPPARPNEGGHFDDLEVGSPEFEAAHLYGAARRVLDIWESYFGRRIEWHSRTDFDRLELVLLRDLDNALMGYGFMEVGSHFTETGEARPFSLNFDVIAHEVGHSIIYAEIGVPNQATEAGEYYGFHESAADLVAIVSVLHFDSVVDHLLEATSGNLYTLNKLNRIAELSDNDQVRLAANPSKLSDFSAGWTDEHDLSLPLTGAMFDIFIDIFHENLLDRGLISEHLEELSDLAEDRPELADLTQSLFDEAYRERHDGFKDALLDARDQLGIFLVETWSRLSPHFLGYDDVGVALLEADREIAGDRYREIIRYNFQRRDIGSAVVGPRLSPPTPGSHAFSTRTVMPDVPRYMPKLSYRERMTIAHGGRAEIGY